MKCPECPGTTFEDGRFDIAQIFQGAPVLLRNVPGHRCCQCDYLIVSARTAAQTERTLAAGQPVGTVPAAVYDVEKTEQDHAAEAATYPQTDACG